jgi:hypothetical protein
VCIRRVEHEKPGSDCAHPLKAGIGFDHEPPVGVGVKVISKPVVFADERPAPPGWANFTMGPVANEVARSRHVEYATIGWTLNTKVVALCRVILFEDLPYYFHFHSKILPNRTEARYNIAAAGGYTYGLTLFDRYVHK